KPRIDGEAARQRGDLGLQRVGRARALLGRAREGADDLEDAPADLPELLRPEAARRAGVGGEAQARGDLRRLGVEGNEVLVAGDACALQRLGRGLALDAA